MRKLMAVALLASLMCLPAGVSWGQRTVGRDTGRDSGRDSGRGSGRDSGRSATGAGTINFSDISERQTRSKERDERQKKQAEDAKKKAEEQRREKERADRMKRWQEDRDKRSGGSSTANSNTRSTSGTRTAASARGDKGGKAATAPVTTGGSYDPTTREVTEVMLDAIKTRHVQFDPAEARENPSMILLNAPRTDPTQRRRAADTGIAQPL